jgi:lipopolysaccharide biosynthesis glycosyltransferase
VKLEILTIYNYHNDDPHFHLLKMWLTQISVNNDYSLAIKVLSDKVEPKEVVGWHKFLDFHWIVLKPNKLKRLPITLRVLNRLTKDLELHRKIKNKIKVLNHHNVRFKLFHLSKWPDPFIFLDVDAILFGPISELVEASKNKPFIAINHQRIPKHTEGKEEYLNGGVQIVSRPGYFTFEDFTKQTDNLLCSGHEQALIYTHFRNIGYDYTHPVIDYKWNSCSGYNEVKKVDGKWVCISRGINALDSDLKSNTIPEGSYIMINHYWDEFKPWKVNCPMYEEFQNIVFSEE